MDWDTRHFGFKIARFFPGKIEDVTFAVDWAYAHRVKTLIARCNTTNMPVVHYLLKQQFLLMDTLVRYEYNFERNAPPAVDPEIRVRPACPEDIDAIGTVAHSSFQEYHGHFHSDPGFDRAKCDDLYRIWAVNSCLDKNLADEVLVATEGDRVIGFITLNALSPETGDGVLAGIDPGSQKRGIYRSLIVHAMHWFRERNFKRMELGPLMNNYAVQRIWQRLGFEIYASLYTFHLWLD